MDFPSDFKTFLEKNLSGQWSVDLGVVDHWDDGLEKFVKQYLVVSFDSSQPLPFWMYLADENGKYLQGFTNARYLSIRFLTDSKHCLAISDEIFIFSDVQLLRLIRQSGTWSYEPPRD